MTTLTNKVVINAPVEKIWAILSNLEMLEQYDPTVLKSVVISSQKEGLGAKRKVNMKDGKNWFEEKITDWQPNELLTIQLTDCTFPINGLKHSYTFSGNGNTTTVQQVMEYEVKFGIIGKLLDNLMIRKQTSGGIQLFMAGLKNIAEKNK